MNTAPLSTELKEERQLSSCQSKHWAYGLMVEIPQLHSLVKNPALIHWQVQSKIASDKNHNLDIGRRFVSNISVFGMTTICLGFLSFFASWVAKCSAVVWFALICNPCFHYVVFVMSACCILFFTMCLIIPFPVLMSLIYLLFLFILTVTFDVNSIKLGKR